MCYSKGNIWIPIFGPRTLGWGFWTGLAWPGRGGTGIGGGRWDRGEGEGADCQGRVYPPGNVETAGAS